MKKMLIPALVLLLVCFDVASVRAESKYPEKPIEAIVGYNAGSTHDAAARVMAAFLSKTLGQPVIVMNKWGGQGSVAGNYLVKSKPDGYTLGFFNAVQIVPEMLLNAKLFSYTSKDIMAVAQWSATGSAVFVKYQAPYRSAAELIEYCQKNPNKLRWGHTGVGNRYWLAGALFKQMSGIKTLEVPFQGDGELTTALLGNHIEVATMTLGGITMAQLEAKNLRALFVTDAKRSPLVPDVPSSNEVGYPLLSADAYLGTFVPPKTPENIVAKLNDAIKAVTDDPQFKEKMRQIYWPVDYRGPKEFTDLALKDGRERHEFLKKFGQLF
jgi:tripartite-type tricarboxylate transporter receptor subunit TctC